MKTINLLKEGHGLRYSPSPPALDDPVRPPLERPAPRKPRRRAGKLVVALVLVVLSAGGGWWVYQTYGPWGPRLEALGQFVAGRQAAKPPATPAPTPKPTEAKAPPPPAAAPAPPRPPRVTATQVGRWFRADRAYPFTLLVGSFRKEAPAVAYAGRLSSAGHSVTVAPTDLGTRGRWNRVLLDRYEAISEAREVATRLKGHDPINDVLAMRLPYAVVVGREETHEAAKAARNTLAAKGIPVHLFPEAAGPEEPVTFLLLAGAYSSQDQAEAFATTLKQAGVAAEVVSP